MDVYDAVIAGGGPAGSAAAITLARAGIRVLLVDRGGVSEFRLGEGLPPPAHHLLATLGLLERTLADGHRRTFGTVSAWGSAELKYHDFVFQLQDCGLQLDRARFDHTLRCAALEAGARIHSAGTLRLRRSESRRLGESYLLDLVANDRVDSLQSRWIIDATGRTASFSRSLGATRVDTDSLMGIYLRCPPARGRADEQASTLIEAVENGWWYSVLLPSGERLVVFLTDADLIDHRAILTLDGFFRCLRLTRHIWERVALHPWQQSTTPRGANARTSRLDPATGERWLAVGDAALTFDPLSSKGIANALHTGLFGAQTVIAAERGDLGACAQFGKLLADIFAVYQVHRHQYYSLERRWCHRPFWRRRQILEKEAIGVTA